MNTTNPPTFSHLGKLLLIVALPLYILDQITKWWVVYRFSEPVAGRFGTFDEPIVVIEGFFNLTRVHNQGVAFGFGNGSAWAPIVFLLVPLIAVTLLLVFWRKGAFTTPLMKTACVLLFAGIAGNVTDRLLQGFWLERLKEASWWERFSAGYVVDFLDVTIPLINYRWPTFNVADSCISVAAVLLVIASFREEAQKNK
ncbi:signal peptidase II [Roseibacillus ishigakijimensis]|uniref:Lipoprotein signal peptidase n=1 Tax=Roseibacillus ishigakijimensis TaxID=454146 RepID=A0A934RNC5_9BACT|nr:signal peptidase II [Roseibacillus ishigakijimensis]MBK1832556.1 signal peptidase II [Roseibacillus ishigakijimensis]